MKTSRHFVLFAFLWGMMRVMQLSGQADAHEDNFLGGGLIHEAYLPAITGLASLDAIQLEPPASIQEQTPVQDDPLTIWIPGYWAWSANHNDFIWVSGIWRRPPPGRQWIPGSWEQFEEGWVYLSGFWAPDNQANLTYLSDIPPDPLEENIPDAPGEDYFWDPGYWAYIADVGDYIWISGEWRKMDPNWILVPNSYTWRPQGYVFIPSYWDWTIESRGQVYKPVYIQSEERVDFVYRPVEVINPEMIVQQCITYYPNYVYFYHHYSYFHPEIWTTFSFVPPWWGWNSWWAFNWHDQWGLWWWYTHPGYPQPYWIDATISSQLPPPPPIVVTIGKHLVPPPIVTSVGVVKSNELLDIISHYEGKPSKFTKPIVPSNPRIKARLARELKKEEKAPSTVLRPSAKKPWSEFAKANKKDVPAPKFKNQFLSSQDLFRGKQKISKDELEKLRQRFKTARLPTKPDEQTLEKYRQNLEQKKDPRSKQPSREWQQSQDKQRKLRQKGEDSPLERARRVQSQRQQVLKQVEQGQQLRGWDADQRQELLERAKERQLQRQDTLQQWLQGRQLRDQNADQRQELLERAQERQLQRQNTVQQVQQGRQVQQVQQAMQRPQMKDQEAGFQRGSKSADRKQDD